VISPDLTRNDKSKQGFSGGLTGDNIGVEYADVVFALAESPKQDGLIWAGTNDGLVQVTRDGGKNWINVTANIHGLPEWGTISNIEASRYDAGTAYITVDGHQENNRDPFIYKTADFGKTWKPVTGNLPRHSLSYVRTITEDPNCQGLLFAGTGNGLYYSLDDGGKWTPLETGLPHAPVTWAVVQKEFHDLVISTYGRGIYILDDITPLEQMAKNHSDAATILFGSRPAYRFTRGGQMFFTFSLKTAPKDPVELEVLDADGRTLRKLKAKARAGINRVKWDLRYDSPRLIALRTVAPDNAHIWQEPRFRDEDSRPITHWGTKPAEVGPIVAPGNYSVRLKIGDQTYTQPVSVVRDPRSPGSDADIDLSVKTQLRIREDISAVSDRVNQMEWLRKQMEVIEAMLRPPKKKEKEKSLMAEEQGEFGEPETSEEQIVDEAQAKKKAEMLKTVEAMEHKVREIEYKFVSPALVNSDDKYYVEPYRVYLNLIWLNAEVGTGGGDVAGGADFTPTDTQLDSLRTMESEIAAATADYQKLLNEDLSVFNRFLATNNVAAILIATGTGTQESAE
jgi:hypothetical protein